MNKGKKEKKGQKGEKMNDKAVDTGRWTDFLKEGDRHFLTTAALFLIIKTSIPIN